MVIQLCALLLPLLFFTEGHCQCSGSALNLSVGFIPVSFFHISQGNMTCEWLVWTTVSDMGFFLEIETHGSPGQSVNVSDGTSTFILDYDTQMRRLYRPHSGHIHILYTSTSPSDQMFITRMIAGDDFSGTGCNKKGQILEASSSEQYLSTPRYPISSILPEICNWTIETSNNAALTINIENLELDPYEASNAFLEIWESETLAANLCCVLNSSSYTINGPLVILTLYTKEIRANGFILTYKETRLTLGTTDNDVLQMRPISIADPVVKIITRNSDNDVLQMRRICTAGEPCFLIGHVGIQQSFKSQSTCLQLCLLIQGCKSINFSSRNMICHINNSRRDKTTSEYSTNVAGFIYKDADMIPKALAGSCQTNICSHSEMCVPHPTKGNVCILLDQMGYSSIPNNCSLFKCQSLEGYQECEVPGVGTGRVVSMSIWETTYSCSIDDNKVYYGWKKRSVFVDHYCSGTFTVCVTVI